MPTMTIQIGNSDDKLPQREWSQFVSETRFVIDGFNPVVHFFGGSPNWLHWQNVVCNAWDALVTEADWDAFAQDRE